MTASSSATEPKRISATKQSSPVTRSHAATGSSPSSSSATRRSWPGSGRTRTWAASGRPSAAGSSSAA
jgi:hypothetical protein